MPLHTELPIYKTGRDLVALAFNVQQQMPRNFKRTLGEKITVHCCDMLDLMALANASRGQDRAAYIRNLLQRQHATTVLLIAAHRLWFEADAPHQPGFGKFRPGMFMCRWMSRIQLEVVSVRVERLQDISEEDAWAEGCKRGEPDDAGGFFPAEEIDPSGIGHRGWDNARDWYADLWEEINGEGSWDLNPWVWVVEFKRITEGQSHV